MSCTYVNPPLSLLLALLLMPLAALRAADETGARKPTLPDFSPKAEYADSRRMHQGMPSIERARNGRLWAAWYGGGLGEEDGVAQRQRPRRCRPDLRRHGNGRDESHLAHGHVKVPGDDGHDKDRDKAKASRQSITDVTRGQGLRYAYSASTSDEYSFMTTLRFNFMEGVS